MPQRPPHRLLARREVRDLLEAQSGVVARRQLLEIGVGEGDLRALLRGDLVTASPGVYLDHNGPPTWRQRAWTAVLTLWPAALSHESALRGQDGPGRLGHDPTVIDIAVDRRRSAVAPDGVRLHYVSDLHRKTLWTASPPRLRIEHAVLDVAAAASSEMTAIATLADAVQARRTTAARIRDTLDERPRIPRRELLEGVLNTIEHGVNSCLEHGYFTRVERAHGLPAGVLQARRNRAWDDVRYDEYGVIVELDGRTFHDHASGHDHDLERDLDAALLNLLTLRLGWGQTYGRSCSTASKVGLMLQRRGWDGAPLPCPRCPPRLAAHAHRAGRDARPA